jgi:hypothetical protein
MRDTFDKGDPLQGRGAGQAATWFEELGGVASAWDTPDKGDPLQGRGARVSRQAVCNMGFEPSPRRVLDSDAKVQYVRAIAVRRTSRGPFVCREEVECSEDPSNDR